MDPTKTPLNPHNPRIPQFSPISWPIWPFWPIWPIPTIPPLPLLTPNEVDGYFEGVKWREEVLDLVKRLRRCPESLKLAEQIFEVKTGRSRPMKKVRRKRCPVPEHLKDEKYWSKRHANTLSARRSRVKNKNAAASDN